MSDPQHSSRSFAVVTTVFFAMGFITSVIDPLIPGVKAVFHLNFTQSMLTQFTFFLAYGIVSPPAGRIVASVGYGRAVFLALVVTAAGCLVMPLATGMEAYWLVLVALFIIASGLTILQVTANPLAAGLGRPEHAHFRLTLSQAFNSLGAVIGPYFGTMIMLRGGVFSDAAAAAGRQETLRGINASFVVIAALIIGLIVFALATREALESAAPETPRARPPSLIGALASPWARFGALAIFLYVGAEVSVGSLMINFLHQKSVLDVSLETAGKLLMLYWLGAMIGRFAGSMMLARFPASHILGLAAVGATTLCFFVTQSSGIAAAVAALLIGLHNSIMFPTIFTLTLERSTASTAQTSAVLCTAIIGGAILPLATGFLADAVGLRFAFLAPMISYAIIAGFAFASAREPLRTRTVATSLARAD